MATVVPASSISALPAAASLENGLPKHGAIRQRGGDLKVVPEPRALREQIRTAAGEVAATLDRLQPLSQHELEAHARQLLTARSLPEGYAGWTMVMLAGAFWREQIVATSCDRRLLLLPVIAEHAAHCARAADHGGRPRTAKTSNGSTSTSGCLLCQTEACRRQAEELGYQVLPAENSPQLLHKIVGGQIDAIVGVASLTILEKAIDKVLLAGIPCMAVPLLSAELTCAAIDADWVAEMIALEHCPSAVRHAKPGPNYGPLMQAATGMFQNGELQRLMPRLRGGPSLAELNGHGVAGLDPVSGTEAIAYDFLLKGGKHSRPFITLAVYDALTGGHGAGPDAAQHVARLPDAVKRAALSIEIFHKASLVHDDIEDDDEFRYGQRTLHRKYGAATAINVGDYLIGLGYRMVSRETAALGADVTADILDRLADAHMKLAEGQGAELLWRDARDKRLSAHDAMEIYALKTAPAFEAAMHAGLRMAGPLQNYLQPVRAFARHLGIAFQILNDLADWQGDNFNKLIAGGDALGGRPTLLWALALQNSTPDNRRRLEQLATQSDDAAAKVGEIQRLYQAADVFAQAALLVEQHRLEATAVADALDPPALQNLLYYLIGMVLAR